MAHNLLVIIYAIMYLRQIIKTELQLALFLLSSFSLILDSIFCTNKCARRYLNTYTTR